jgi:hypothetical protein
VERKKKELYIRIAVKKLSEEDDEFATLSPHKQLDLIVERAKLIAIEAANDEHEFVPKDAEGHVLNEDGTIDEDATAALQRTNPRFGDGQEAEIGETRRKGRSAGMADGMAGPKRFGSG